MQWIKGYLLRTQSIGCIIMKDGLPIQTDTHGVRVLVDVRPLPRLSSVQKTGDLGSRAIWIDVIATEI